MNVLTFYFNQIVGISTQKMYAFMWLNLMKRNVINYLKLSKDLLFGISNTYY